MTDLAENEQAAIQRFLALGFPENFVPRKLKEAEAAIVERVVDYVANRIGQATYVLGLALDFTMVAQLLSQFDPAAKAFRPGFDEATLFATYPQTTSKTKNVNTLTLTVQHEGKERKIGIRRIEEKVIDLFVAADRSGYPSAYVYNTGMWRSYRDLLVDCFRLSESGRFLLCKRLIAFGLERLGKNTYFGRTRARPRLFETIMTEYPRTGGAGENAGTVFQGIAYGYVHADRPHLSLIVDKSRTGSARQRRFGDVDGYFGLALEVAIEVKDEPIRGSTVETELGQFARDVSRHNVQGLVIATDSDSTANSWLEGFGVYVVDQATILSTVKLWDWRKQDAATHGLLHFLSHVEQRPEAVRRLMEFIREKDPTHDSLNDLRPPESPKG